MPERPDACATLARVLAEPLPGTAPEAVGWLLVEDPGPWGRDALLDGTLPAAAVAHLQAAMTDRPIRYQAVRRHHRPRRARRNVLLAHGGATPWLRRLELPVEDLDGLDPAVTLSPSPPADLGLPDDGPVLLVCTHGTRDACCAERGRPVAAALATHVPDLAWETSHTGGHRFAPNVILLPSGIVYGFLDEDAALAAVDAWGAGRLDLEHLRGHARDPRPGQAAEVAVRRAHGWDRLDDVRVEDTRVEGMDAQVRLATPDGSATVTLRHRSLSVRPVSCGADPTDPGTWEVTSPVA